MIEEEREFLKDNHIPIPETNGSNNAIQDDAVAQEEEDQEDNIIRDTFENAIINKEIQSTTSTIELKNLIKSSIPLVVTFLLQNSLSTVSVFSVGHLGATELAAVSMGAMTANITGYATIQGIATALDTLCPQAFGAKNIN